MENLQKIEKAKTLAITGVVTYQQFRDKDTGEAKPYIAIDIENPFKQGKLLRVSIKKPEQAGAFKALAEQQLELLPLDYKFN